MGTGSNNRKNGLGVAVACLALGLIRTLVDGAADWLSWTCLVLAAFYALAPLVGYHLVAGGAVEALLGRPHGRPHYAASPPEYHSMYAESAARSSRYDSIEAQIELAKGGEVGVTKNRIGNVLATLGAIVGMVLVFTGAGQKGDDDAPGTPPPSQVAPAVPGQSQPGAPAQSQAPAPGQTQAPAPAAPKDNDGDDDGN